MTTVHLGIAILLASAVALTLIASLVGLFGPYRGRLVDRLLLADGGVLLLATISGPPLLVAGHGPADPLHFLYAVLAWIALPIARYFAARGTDRRRAAAMTIGCLVTAGVVARLFMTGS